MELDPIVLYNSILRLKYEMTRGAGYSNRNDFAIDWSDDDVFIEIREKTPKFGAIYDPVDDDEEAMFEIDEDAISNVTVLSCKSAPAMKQGKGKISSELYNSAM